jgi:chromosome segregation protein
LRDSITALQSANDKAREDIERSQAKVQELEGERARLEEENRVLGDDSEVNEMNALLEREREALQVMRDKVDDLRTQSRELSNARLEAANKVNALGSRF